MNKLSVVLATFNEENNIGKCLSSVKEIADEIIIVDGTSTDKTVEIAKEYGARVIIKDNPPIFHVNKQRALDEAKNTWILQLDADEQVSKDLAREIIKIINFSDSEIEIYQQSLSHRSLFLRHEEQLVKRDGQIGKQSGEYAAFFIPRANYFLGRYLRYGGVYPDGVIRLVKKNKAHFPCVHVHEQIEVDGKVGWLDSDLLHYDSPNFKRYLFRNNRYTTLMSKDFQKEKKKKNVSNLLLYLFYYPVHWFFLTYIRHKGILDGWQGFVFSFFSSLRFPIAYIKYLSLR